MGQTGLKEISCLALSRGSLKASRDAIVSTPEVSAFLYIEANSLSPGHWGKVLVQLEVSLGDFGDAPGAAVSPPGQNFPGEGCTRSHSC